MSSSSSSISDVSSSRRVREKDNDNPSLTGMALGFQDLEERITTTQPVHISSIIDIIGCDITIDDIQTTKQELIKQKFDLRKDVNKSQVVSRFYEVTPLIHFCWTGNLLIVKLLFLIGADSTKLNEYRYRFPMYAAAVEGHLDICQWLFEYGGDAKYQINKESNLGHTPLEQSYTAWIFGKEREGKTCRWLLQNGGGQHLSSEAMSCLRIDGKEETNSNLLVLWMRENIQLHGTFILLLCGATTMITSSSSSSSSELNDGGTRKHKRSRKRHPEERALQILDGHPGIMELIGDYVGLLRGKEIRRLQEFNELVQDYNYVYEISNVDDDDY